MNEAGGGGVLISEGTECAHFKETAAMKKTAIAFALLVTILASCEGVRAQKPALKSTPVTIAPDLTKLNMEKMLQQVQTANVQPSTQERLRYRWWLNSCNFSPAN